MSEYLRSREPVRESLERSENWKKLHELEASGEFVFHGSPAEDIEELEVRQPHDWKTGERVEHGEPSVVATPYVDIAIFRSLVFMDSTGFGVGDDGANFRASKKALDAAQGNSGFIYVMPKDRFVPMDGNEDEMDWRSKESQRPVQVIEVAFSDLPETIELIELSK